MRELGLRHSQKFGLPAGHRAVQLGVAEQRGAHALVAHLRRLALGEQLQIAHIATAAGDLEGNDHAVTDREIGDAAADFRDDAHRFVAEDVARLHERPQYLVEV